MGKQQVYAHINTATDYQLVSEYYDVMCTFRPNDKATDDKQELLYIMREEIKKREAEKNEKWIL